MISNGSVDRGALGSIVFDDPVALERLNVITHGPLSSLAAVRMDDIAKTRLHRLAVLEAAVYFLLPPVPGVELVITVTAAEATRIDRLMKWSGLDREEARTRVHAQRSLEKGWSDADIVLVNEDSLGSLEAEAAALLTRFED